MDAAVPVSLAGAATGASGWDTDARAVPGPSNHLLFKTSTASSAPARPTPAAPESRSAPPPASSSQTEGDFVNVVMPDGGKSRGPVIVPTVLDPDGVKVVPASFELCEVEDLIILIASMLDRLILHNDRIPLTPTSLTRFHSRAPPSITISSYLLRISRYTNVEPCCLLILLSYVDKVCARLSDFTISSLTVHRFVIAGVSVGSKALSDAFCTNGRYARVGGVSLTEMCLLEKEFCEAIDWRLTTTGAVLAHYYTSLVRSHPAYRLASAIVAAPTPVLLAQPTPERSDEALEPAHLERATRRSDDTAMPNVSTSAATISSVLKTAPPLIPAPVKLDLGGGTGSKLNSPVSRNSALPSTLKHSTSNLVLHHSLIDPAPVAAPGSASTSASSTSGSASSRAISIDIPVPTSLASHHGAGGPLSRQNFDVGSPTSRSYDTAQPFGLSSQPIGRVNGLEMDLDEEPARGEDEDRERFGGGSQRQVNGGRVNGTDQRDTRSGGTLLGGGTAGREPG